MSIEVQGTYILDQSRYRVIRVCLLIWSARPDTNPFRKEASPKSGNPFNALRLVVSCCLCDMCGMFRAVLQLFQQLPKGTLLHRKVGQYGNQSTVCFR